MATLSWPDRVAYPFTPHYFDLPAGRMHYVDTGTGSPIVFVHGTPVWSFLYRAFIQEFSHDHRCIAPDHLGFGMSDKPVGANYRPQAHATNLAGLIEGLDLRDITLVVHDFGGPIGLSYALDHPENVRRLVIFNTWMWSLNDEPPVMQASRLFGSALGRFLYTRLNISPRQLYPLAFGDKTKLRRDVQHQYINATTMPEERLAMWTFARELIGSSDWYTQLWARRAVLRDLPTLLIWGMRDPTFPPKQLARWQGALPHATVVTFPESGHFVQEEQPEAAIKAIRGFFSSTM